MEGKFYKISIIESGDIDVGYLKGDEVFRMGEGLLYAVHVITDSFPKLRNSTPTKYVVLCAIWNHSYNLKNVKNTHGGTLFLVKLQAKVCNFAKSNTLPWVLFTFFKLCTWY